MSLRKKWIAAALLGLLVSACVTINIYFPAAAAEKAADRIIDEVWKNQQKGEAAADPTKQSDEEVK